MRALILMTVFASACFLSACSTVPERMQKLDIGMSKDEVTHVMGSPDQTAANSRSEAYFYRQDWNWYYVNFNDGKVESFGQQPVSAAQMQARARIASAYLMSHPISQPAPATFYQMPVSHPINCTTNQIGTTAFTNCN